MVDLPTLDEIDAVWLRLMSLLDEHLPLCFSRDEPLEGVLAATGAALVMKVATTGKSMMLLAHCGHETDAEALPRTQFESFVTLAWIMIDPWKHTLRWEQATMEHDHAKFGRMLELGLAQITAEDLQRSRDLAESQMRPVPGVRAMVDDVNTHWRGQLGRFSEREDWLVPFVPIVFMAGSESIHAHIRHITDSFISAHDDEWRLGWESITDSAHRSAFLATIWMNLALCVTARTFNWPPFNDVISAFEGKDLTEE